MKKFTFVMSTLLAAVSLAGCQQDGGKTETEEQHEVIDKEAAVKNVEKEEKVHVHEGKELRTRDELEEHALLTWDVADDLAVYVVKEDGAVDTFEHTTALGEAGEEYFSGKVSLFVVYKEDEVGYLQDELDQAMIRLDESALKPFTIGENTFIGWTTNETSTASSIRLWVLQNEELKPVQIDEEDERMISHQTMKVIDDQYWQVYSYNNSDLNGGTIGWYFTTYKWNEEEAQFTTFAEEVIENDAYDFGAEFIEEWHEDQDVYVNYGQLSITEDDVARMKNGIFLFDHIQIGRSIKEVEKYYGEPKDRFYDRGAPAYSYQDGLVVVYDEVEEDVLVIMINGMAISNDLKNLRSLFGEPEFDQFLEGEGAYMVQYDLGQYHVNITYDEDENIYEVSLMQKNNGE